MAKDTKQLISEHAASLFLEHGYHQTSLKMVAERAGIQPPAIYYHFKDKEAIFVHIRKTGVESFRERVIKKVNEVEDTEGKVVTFITETIRLVNRSKELRYLIAEDFPPRKVKKSREENREQIFGFTMPLLEELAKTKGIGIPIDLQVATSVLIAISTSPINRWMKLEDIVSEEDLIRDVTTLFFQGFYSSQVSFDQSRLTRHTVPDLLLSLRDPDSVKDQLAREAKKAFLEYGYHKTSLKGLAKATGLHLPAIYRHFKSKEEILIYVYESIVREGQQRLDQEMNRPGSPEEILEYVVSYVITLMLKFRDFPILTWEHFPSKKLMEIKKQRLEKFNSNLIDTIRALAKEKDLQSPIHPAVVLHFLFSATMWVRRWHDQVDYDDVDDLRVNLIRLFFGGFYAGQAKVYLQGYGATPTSRASTSQELPAFQSSMENGRLIGGICSSCNHIFHPKSPVCPLCGENRIRDYALSTSGRIVDYSVTMAEANAPGGAPIGPLVLAQVELPEKVKILGLLTHMDDQQIRIGADVELYTWRTGASKDGREICAFAFRGVDSKKR